MTYKLIAEWSNKVASTGTLWYKPADQITKDFLLAILGRRRTALSKMSKEALEDEGVKFEVIS